MRKLVRIILVVLIISGDYVYILNIYISMSK